jgi:hypothetical protein
VPAKQHVLSVAICTLNQSGSGRWKNIPTVTSLIEVIAPYFEAILCYMIKKCQAAFQPPADLRRDFSFYRRVALRTGYN